MKRADTLHALNCPCADCRQPHPADAPRALGWAPQIAIGFPVMQLLLLAVDWLRGTRGVLEFWGL